LDEGVEVKIVVLGDPVGDKFTSTRDFAQQVLLGLGDGERRVVVYDPGDVGIASNVDSADEIEQAERAAIDAANRSDSFADGAQAAVTVLRADEEGAAAPAAAEDDGDGFPWGVVLLLLVVIAVVVLVVVWFLRRSSRRTADAADRVGVEGAEVKVREVIDRISRRVLDLADRLKGGQPAEAARLYEEGSDVFLDLQDDLEAADTRSELESVWPRIVDADWKLASAAALLEGQPAPPAPAVEPLFPPPVAPPTPQAAPGQAPAAPGSPLPGPASVPPPAQDRGYRGFDVSPWLTQAAIAAVTMLASRRGRSAPQHREPMGSDVFGDVFGGLGPGSSWGGGGDGGGASRSRGRPRIRIGGRSGGAGRGRGMGRRR
jgi:hypothetical protein